MTVQRQVIAVEKAERKLSAALAARRGSGPSIIARTDARSVEGFEAAIERGRRYAATGIDALFIEAPVSVDELRTIGKSFDLPLVVNAAEGGRTPVLSPTEYREMGFSIILYPATLLLRMVGLFDQVLGDLRNGQFTPGPLPTFATLTDVVGTPEWMAVDARFG